MRLLELEPQNSLRSFFVMAMGHSPPQRLYWFKIAFPWVFVIMHRRSLKDICKFDLYDLVLIFFAFYVYLGKIFSQ